MVEVFKTNINSSKLADKIKSNLEDIFPDYKVNFDLDDCDKILRVEALSPDCEKIIEIVNSLGNKIAILEEWFTKIVEAYFGKFCFQIGSISIYDL